MFGSFSNFSKALESIGQLVAPVNEDTEQPGHDDGDEEGNPFDNAIMQFIQKKRGQDDTPTQLSERQQPEPGSPSSLVDIALDDEGSTQSRRRSLSSTTSDDSSLPPPPMLSNLLLELNNNNAASSRAAPKAVDFERPIASSLSCPSPAVFLSNAELEKKVQTKYRESLEDEVLSAQKKVQQLGDECAYWKEKAQASTPTQPTVNMTPCTKCKSVQSELSDAKQELQGHILTSKATQEKYLALQISYQQAVIDKEALQREVNALKGEVHTATNQHIASIEKHEVELRAYKEKLATQETQVNMQRGLFLESERTNDLLRAEIQTLQRELRSHKDQKQCSAESNGSSSSDSVIISLRGEVERLDKEVSVLRQSLEASERKLKTTPKSRLFVTDEEFSLLSVAVQSVCKLLEISSTTSTSAHILSSPTPQPPPTPTLSTPYFLPAADVSTPHSDEGGAEVHVALTTTTLLYVLTLAQDRLACPPTPLPVPSAATSSTHNAVHEEQVKKLEQDKARLTNQVQEHATLVDELKRHVAKCENENRQLHEVISQLRQSRKQHSQTSEQTQQEIISLRAALSDTEKQLQGLRDKVAYYQDFEGKYGAILPSYTALQSGYDDVATRYTHCQAALQQREKELYTLQASFEALSADYKLALQQTQQQSLQMDNLHQALSSLEKEGKQDSLTYKHQLAELQREIGEYKQSLEKVKEYEHTIATLNAQLKEARQQSEDMVLKCRQLEYEYNRDRKTLQTKLEEVIAQYTNSVKKDHSDTIDRHIIANLVVSYFQRKRSKEVLELIAKVLCFDEQQLVDVGLRVNPNVSLLGTLWTSVVGGEVPGSNPVPVEGDNLAELWINFLLRETEGKKKASGNNSNTSNSPVPSPRNASALATMPANSSSTNK